MTNTHATADIQTLVIGAGVVGLATGAALTSAGHNVVVVERDNQIGQGISSRNSEVIHAGIYYPQGSLKARLCVRGRELLYKYCSERSVACKRIGKLIVATDLSEVDTLDDLQQKATDNGVDDLVKIPAPEAIAMQPGLHCEAALHSPSTGIVDSHALMLSLQAEIESGHGQVVCRTEVSSINIKNHNLFKVKLGDGTTVTANNVINSGGLHSTSLARKINPQVNLRNTIPDASYAKGNYFRLQTPAPFTKLIYPAPVIGGLGIHLTIDLAGQKRFGPDVEWLSESYADDLDYTVNNDRCHDFYTAIRRYYPALPDDSLVPDYTGIRPKIKWHNNVATDFAISTEQQHGIAGLVNLYGIESPGLTASLAIAEHISNSLL